VTSTSCGGERWPAVSPEATQNVNTPSGIGWRRDRPGNEVAAMLGGFRITRVAGARRRILHSTPSEEEVHARRPPPKPAGSRVIMARGRCPDRRHLVVDLVDSLENTATGLTEPGLSTVVEKAIGAMFERHEQRQQSSRLLYSSAA